MKRHFLAGLLLAMVLASLLSFPSCDDGYGGKPADMARQREHFEAQRRQQLPRMLEQARVAANFEVVLPGYLPAGFEMDGVFAFPTDFRATEGGPSRASVWLTFMNRPARATMTIIEAASLGQPRVERPETDYASAKIGGVSVVIGEGTAYTAIADRSPGSAGSTVVGERDAGVGAFWTHRGVSFALLISGVSREEAEKVIASMIE
ncbi:MAG: hypothetical protein HY673_03400 [Chloroflexi bacterium]|nr:hypothetical protein [Chloroflexota bacterium]